MADIHILQNASTPADHVRAYRMLCRSIELGEDLGCRQHHIKAIAASLQTAHHELRLTIDTMRLLPSLPGLNLGVLADEVEAWSQAMASLTKTIAHDAFESRAGALLNIDPHNSD